MSRAPTENRLDRILDAAESVFCDVGPRDATVADIAAVAGLGAATIYRAVENKTALFQWCLVRAWDPDRPLPAEPLPVMDAFDRSAAKLFPLSKRLPVLYAKPTASIGFLRDLVAEQFDFQMTNMRWLDLAEALQADPDAPEWVRKAFDGLLARGAAAVGELAHGRVIAGDWPPSTAASFIIANCAFYGRSLVRQYPVMTDSQARRERVVARILRALTRCVAA